MKKLRETHEAKFSQMQYRIWTELINSGIYTSLTEPPHSSMFKRAGPAATTTATSSSSPMKTVDIRSKCYHQLHELKTLKTAGVLTVEEYEHEKKAIMETLKAL